MTRALAILAGFACGFVIVYSVAEARPVLSYPRAVASADSHSTGTITGCKRHSRTRFLCREWYAFDNEQRTAVGTVECFIAERMRHDRTVANRLLRCDLLTMEIDLGKIEEEETANEGSK